MKKNEISHGVWTALITPFLPGECGIDWENLEKLVALQVDAGINGIVVCGTTGEASTLTLQEKLALIRKIKALAFGRVQIMAGVGTSSTAQTVEMSKLAVDAGADSLLVVTPPYIKPTITGLKQHYSEIVDKAGVPVCLYHVPGRTAQMLTPDQLSLLCRDCQITAIKEASGNLPFFAQTVAKCRASIFSGDDFTYLPSIAVGATGVISVISNLYPAEIVALTQQAFAGDLALARRYHYALLPALEALFCETSPGPLKAALAMKKMCHNVLRLPLAPVEDSSYQKIQSALLETESCLRRG